MKNTQFALLIAVLGFFGLVTGANAQLLPGSQAVLNTGAIASLTGTASTNTLVLGTLVPASTISTNAITASNPTVTTSSITALPASSAIANITAITAVNSGVVPTNTITAQVYPNANTINSTNLVPVVNSNIATTPTPVVTTTQTPVVQNPVVSSNGGTGVVSIGQYSGGGLYGAQLNQNYSGYASPVATSSQNQASRVVYKTIYKQAEPVKEIIPLLPEDNQIAERDTHLAASTFGLGNGMNLIAVLGVIAGVLALMVARQEYQARKRIQAHAHYA